MKPGVTAIRDALFGIACGASTALVLRLAKSFVPLPTILRTLPSATLTFLKSSDFWMLASSIVATALLLLAGRISLFLTRLYRSWSAGIITGISFIWFLLAAFFFLPHAHGARHLALFIAIGAVPIVGSQVISRRRLQAEIVLPLDIPKMEASPDAPSDQREVTFDLPINDWTKDRLNRGPLIQSTAQLILRDKAPVIAIVGGFGEGKTSALNLLATSLKARRDMLVVQFSSWLPGGTERLADSLFATVSQHINSRYVVPGLGRELRRFAKLLAGTVPKLGENLKQFLEEPSQTEQLRSLKELLARLPLRVVVLVDELDRMDKAELLLLLKAIRGVVDLPNVTYVCAFDRSSVVRLISEDRQYGESYLEKFFPVQRRLPRVDQEVLGAVFDKELERICLALGLLRNEDERKKFNEKLLPLWHNPVKHVLRNFCKMAIFFNSLHGALAPISAEVNVFDMVVLQLVKFVSEDAYEFIYDNGPLFYNPAWRVDLWPERVAVEDDRAAAVYKERFDSFFASMAAPSRDQLRELLQAIFPTVKGYSRGERISFRGTNDELADKGRLIYHPDYFPRYFIQQVQTSMFGIAEMSRFIDEMNREDGVDPSLHKFRQVTDGLGKNTWKRWSFLDQLVTECDRLGDLQAEAVVLGVAGISDSLEEEVLGLGEWGRARALVFAATKRFAGTPKLEGVLETAISKSTSDGFSADILRFSTMMKDRNNIITDWTGVTEGALRAAFAERMRSRYAIGSQREFPYGRLGDISAFHLWVKTSDGDKELEVAFLRDRFARFPIEQGRFLAGVLPNTVVFEGDPLDTVGNLFPLDELHELVKAVRLETFAESDRDSVRRFLNLMARRSGGEAETDSPGSHP